MHGKDGHSEKDGKWEGEFTSCTMIVRMNVLVCRSQTRMYPSWQPANKISSRATRERTAPCVHSMVLRSFKPSDEHFQT